MDGIASSGMESIGSIVTSQEKKAISGGGSGESSSFGPNLKIVARMYGHSCTARSCQ